MLHDSRSLGFAAKFAENADAEVVVKKKKSRVESAQPRMETKKVAREPKPAHRIGKNPWKGSKEGVWAKPAWGPVGDHDLKKDNEEPGKEPAPVLSEPEAPPEPELADPHPTVAETPATPP